ncbi:MAG: hypothetical protein KF796_17430 [Ramlibacter sp.]|nr:hypothetical protein [Ramlibacter sp.]
MTPLPSLRVLVLAAAIAGFALPASAQFPSFLGKVLGGGSTPDAATPTVAGTAPAPVPPATAAQIEEALKTPLALLDASGSAKGTVEKLKGRRFYVSEYRVMFEQSGSITASSRAAYLGGTNYGGTRMTVKYAASSPDLAVLQAVTDKAYADFLARLEAAGAKPEPAEAIIGEYGAVYEATVDASKPGAPVVEEMNFGYGKRSYLVLAPSGMKLNPRGFAGLGAGNISNRIAYGKAGVDAISVVMSINMAAQESSGSGSSLFRRGSTANASAAMEVAAVPTMVLLQSHAATHMMRLESPLAVPGQFASFRETGGYDTRKDGVMQGLTMLGAITGHAVNQSKSVEMAVDIDPLAMAPLALQGLMSVNQAIAAGIR